MADEPRIGPIDRRRLPLPSPMLDPDNLAASPHEVRGDHVARARLRAAARCFDDREVVQEIATQLLVLSATPPRS